MCIRKVFECPDCGQYFPIPELTSEDLYSNNVPIVVVYEEPCGFTYCDKYVHLFPFVRATFEASHVYHQCSVRCDFRQCKVLPILRSCCRPEKITHDVRLVSLAMIREQDQRQREHHQHQQHHHRHRIGRQQQQQQQTGSDSSSSVPPSLIERSELSKILHDNCSTAIYREVYRGGMVLICHESLRLELTARRRTGYIAIEVTDSVRPGCQEYEFSYGWLLADAFWKEENQRRTLDLRSIFSL